MDQQAVEGWKGEIVQAGVDGVTRGLRASLPVVIALVLIGPWICAYMAFAHFILGIEIRPSVISGGVLGTVGVGASVAWQYFKRPKGPRTPDDE